jgi:hypothetical protein
MRETNRCCWRERYRVFRSSCALTATVRPPGRRRSSDPPSTCSTTGFQHVQLWRDVDLLLVDERDLDDRVLPAGRLREPLANAAAAHTP